MTDRFYSMEFVAGNKPGPKKKKASDKKVARSVTLDYDIDQLLPSTGGRRSDEINRILRKAFGLKERLK